MRRAVPAVAGEGGVAAQGARGRRAGRGVTVRPAAARRRAATKPSPPLLPGPATTRTGPSRTRRSGGVGDGARRRLPSGSMPGVPAAIVRRSASAISAAVRSSCMWMRASGMRPDRRERRKAGAATIATREGAAVTARNLEVALNPRSVAVFGASERPGTPRRGADGEPARGRLPGPIWPVNPRRRTVFGRDRWRRGGSAGGAGPRGGGDRPRRCRRSSPRSGRVAAGRRRWWRAHRGERAAPGDA